ncbi:hypothetical protein BU16DRAFT_558214 [Lophium mytilinum]|uniref:RING-type domain-containing protein n=1 Tax=Lophium mytilinum TaxID=390894 RepID=A0A6A6R062_9PEZI|nr:hypothetical protein BU16DRAFT_558214 [Lophium mytilinum]
MSPTIPSDATEFIANNLTAIDASHAEVELLEDCPICQERFSEKDPPVQITDSANCSHIFGKDCLKSWLSSGMNNQNTCPLCRAKLYGVTERFSWAPDHGWERIGAGGIRGTFRGADYDGVTVLNTLIARLRERRAPSAMNTIRNDEELEQVSGELGPSPRWEQGPELEEAGSIGQHEGDESRELEGERSLLGFWERTLSLNRTPRRAPLGRMPRRGPFPRVDNSAFLASRCQREEDLRQERGQGQQVDDEIQLGFAAAVPAPLDTPSPELSMGNRLASGSTSPSTSRSASRSASGFAADSVPRSASRSTPRSASRSAASGFAAGSTPQFAPRSDPESKSL